MANEVVGNSITLVEIDQDEYRATQFEAVTPYSSEIADWVQQWGGESLIRGMAHSTFPSGRGIQLVQPGSGPPSLWAWQVPSAIRDISVLAKLRWESAPNSIAMGVLVRGRGSGGGEDGYILKLVGGSSQTLEILKLRNGSLTLLASASFTPEANVDYWFLFDSINVDGGSTATLRGKVWTGEIDDAPDDWMVTNDDASNPNNNGGYVGLYIDGTIGPAEFSCGFFRTKSYLSNVEETIRYSKSSDNLPIAFNSIPSIEGISITPATVSLGADLGIRETIQIKFKDHLHADLGEFFNNGTYWGRYRARDLYRRNLNLRIKTGLLGYALNDFEIRHYITDKFSGPDPNSGQFTITARDVLDQVDDKKSQAPVPTNGYLATSITSGATSATLAPTGIGNQEYATSGYVNIGGKEICTFTRSGDSLTLTRAQFNTTAVAHSAEDRVQQCLYLQSQSPATIINTLFTTFANIDSSLIPLTEWESEVDTNLQKLYTRLIAEPTGVNKLVSELIEQAGLIVWWSNLDRLIQLQVLKGILTDAFEYNEENTIINSIKVEEQRDTQLTEVWTYYAVRNPCEPLDQVDNYRSSIVTTNGEAATLNGSPIIKKIFGTWIPSLGRSIAERANNVQIGRFVVPPRKINFNVPRYSGISLPVLAGGYRFKYYGSQDEAGQNVSIPIQVTKVDPRDDHLAVEAQEMLFRTLDADDLTNRVITVESSVNGFNLRTAHDSLYTPITAADLVASPTVSVTCVVNSNVIIGATSSTGRAFDVGDWPFLPPINIIINGRLQGPGGRGGDAVVGNGQSGQAAGGTAFYTRVAVNLTYTSGKIWGGGGGGGGTGFSGGASDGGGGGAGIPAGAGGSKGTASGHDGNAGSQDAGGSAVLGGDGGNPGQAGAVASGGGGAPPGLGGAAGRAIDGVSFVTVVGAAGDLRGSTAN